MEKKASTSWTPLNFPESTGKRSVFRVYLKDPWMKKGEQKLGRTKTTVHREGEKEAVQQGAVAFTFRWCCQMDGQPGAGAELTLLSPHLQTSTGYSTLHMSYISFPSQTMLTPHHRIRSIYNRPINSIALSQCPRAETFTGTVLCHGSAVPGADVFRTTLLQTFLLSWPDLSVQVFLF